MLSKKPTVQFNGTKEQEKENGPKMFGSLAAFNMCTDSV